jgi:hypothetical protein
MVTSNLENSYPRDLFHYENRTIEIKNEKHMYVLFSCSNLLKFIVS